MKRRKSELPQRVELLNCPHYRQGSFDGLCAYYTGAMILTSLYPEYEKKFGLNGLNNKRNRFTQSVIQDPLIINTDGQNRDSNFLLARWFCKGEWIENVTKILNRLMREANKTTRFECIPRGAWDNTYYDYIGGSIREGLPVMLGWNTDDYGDHAVLVTGYWEGNERWLVINDPSSDHDEISWDSLSHQKYGKFEVGRVKPATHSVYRPMKMEYIGDESSVFRWVGPESGYEKIDFG